jgi:hypothetical protein
MTHADPWDEIARLEKQMQSELLGQLEVPRPGVLTRPQLQSPSSRGRVAAFTSLRPRDANVDRL